MRDSYSLRLTKPFVVDNVQPYFATTCATQSPSERATFINNKLDLCEKLTEEIMGDIDMFETLLMFRRYDKLSFFHGFNVACLSFAFGAELGLEEYDLRNLVRGAILHDIGKTKVPLSILNKPSALTKAEYDIVKAHTQYGHDEAIKIFPNLHKDSLACILSHHENIDGTGYPSGLAGSNIPFFAQIVALADIYDALTTVRTYRGAASKLPYEAIQYLMDNSGIIFDKSLVESFVKYISVYSVGSLVALNNNTHGIICETYQGATLRPKVEVFLDNTKGTSELVNLLDIKNKHLEIIKVLSQ